MPAVIRVENLGKRYRLGEREPYQTLRDSIVRWSAAPFRGAASLIRNGPAAAVKESHVWALREVNLEVAQGEVLGLIGRNGAGKSTLLKILARITEPTTGRAELHGRVGSLLEVGTGFHPELTGRDNIFLSGAILGMRRREIARKFDEIVAFAEVEKFVDTPVKRYSSGMYVRLAFAVAAHMEPEILLVDEVLAVGDAVFQKKCLGKMGEVARAGRTVLFVSHNMVSIESLCTSCVLLAAGRAEAIGEPAAMVDRYMASGMRDDSGTRSLLGHPGRTGGSVPAMTSVTLLTDGAECAGAVRMGSPLSAAVTFLSEAKPLSPVLGMVIRNSHGAAVFGVNNKFIGGYEFPQRITSGIISCNIERLPLMPGTYSLDLYFGDAVQDMDTVLQAISFEVLPADVFGTGKLPPPLCGPVFWPATFELRNGSGHRE